MVLLTAGVSPGEHDMGELEFVRCMGIDEKKDGVTVTVTVNRDGEIVSESGEGGTVVEAVQDISLGGGKYSFFGYVSQFLLGEDTARESMDALFDYVRRDVHSRPETPVYVLRGESAESALSRAGEKGVALSEELSSAERMRGEGGIAVPVTVRSLSAAMERCGSCLIPALRMDGEGHPAPAGYAIIKEEKLAGFLDEELVAAANLLLFDHSAPLVTVKLGDGAVSLSVSSSRCTVTPVVSEGEVAEIRIELEVTMDVASAAGVKNVRDRTEEIKAAALKKLSRETEQVLRRSAVLGADFMDLRSAIKLKAPDCPLSENAKLTLSVTGEVVRSFETTEG